MTEKHSAYEPWVEKYRPKKLKDVVGQGEICERLEAYAKTKDMPHLLFSGRPGIGKTACALALASELYGDAARECFLELNASDERGIDVVRGKIKDFARTIPMADVAFKIIFLDEADALTSEAQQALRRTMERFSDKTRFILSCNYSSRIIEPIQSRCAVFRFAPLKEQDIKKIAEHIAGKEGIKLDAKAMDAVVYVAEGDARKAINVLQGAAFAHKAVGEEDVFKVASRATPKEVGQMVDAALGNRFGEARKLLDSLMVKYGMSGEEILGQIYREIVSKDLAEDKKVLLADRIGEYDFRMVEGASERIQLEALLAQLALAGRK